jgi:DNA-binding MltR family transcriptional regulator
MNVLAEINRGASDRALGIIAASLVEIHLTKLIKQAFIPEVKTGSKETVQELMFHSSGPLGAFSTKIRLAYMMGLISKEFFKDLEIMKEIRNRFAHHTEIVVSISQKYQVAVSILPSWINTSSTRRMVFTVIQAPFSDTKSQELQKA